MPLCSNTLGEVIRTLRKQRGLSQEVLSGLSGVARSHLALIEGGRSSIRVDTLWRIADALGLPLSELIRMAEARPAPPP